MLMGPACLALGFILLLVKTGGLLGRPVWLFGLSLSMGIGCFTSFLAYREVVEQQQKRKHHEEERLKELTSVKETLGETGSLYREKVEKLEVVIQGLESELREIQLAYEQVHGEGQRERLRAGALQTSLEDALDALREARQLDFFKAEEASSLPPDLPAQHRQLRDQFDEKALILNQTRRRLFGVEGQLFALQKNHAEERLASIEDIEILQKEYTSLEGENRNLEEEVQLLEALITELIRTKTSKQRSAPKKKVEQMLELQFDTTT